MYATEHPLIDEERAAYRAYLDTLTTGKEAAS